MIESSASAYYNWCTIYYIELEIETTNEAMQDKEKKDSKNFAIFCCE
jgi:hypothetical protein